MTVPVSVLALADFHKCIDLTGYPYNNISVIVLQRDTAS